MPSIKPVPYQKLVKAFKKLGYRNDRTTGSHIIMVKDGYPRPLVIPKYKGVGVDIIWGLIRSSKISRDEYLELLK